MANVKEVVIFGKIPFNCDENDEMCRILGKLNAPSQGLKISYGSVTLIPNEHGGQTTMYEYSIEGQEAVSMSYIDRIKAAIRGCGGAVHGGSVFDVENNVVLWRN